MHQINLIINTSGSIVSQQSWVPALYITHQKIYDQKNNFMSTSDILETVFVLTEHERDKLEDVFR